MLPKSYIRNLIANYDDEVTISDCTLEFLDNLMEKVVDNIEQYFDDNGSKSPEMLNEYINKNIIEDINTSVKSDLNLQRKIPIVKYIKRYMYLPVSATMYNYIASIVNTILYYMIEELIDTTGKYKKDDIDQQDILNMMMTDYALQSLLLDL